MSKFKKGDLVTSKTPPHEDNSVYGIPPKHRLYEFMGDGPRTGWNNLSENKSILIKPFGAEETAVRGGTRAHYRLATPEEIAEAVTKRIEGEPEYNTFQWAGADWAIDPNVGPTTVYILKK